LTGGNGDKKNNTLENLKGPTLKPFKKKSKHGVAKKD